LIINMKNKMNKGRKGFTMIETLVAIFIFSASVVGIIAISASGISNATFVKQRIIAGQLAQEGVEIIRNMRDTASLYDSWEVFLNEVVNKCTGDGCYVDAEFENINVFECDSPNSSEVTGCPVLNYDDFTGAYTYGTGTETIFKRGITTELLASNDEVIVTVAIAWPRGNKEYVVTVEENLFNWVSLSSPL